jgi:two-component system chemotaxis response regulator CheB
MAIRVLIVDDSAVVRSTLREELCKDQSIEVVGTAPDPYIARDRIVELKPDVITLDIEMPKMDGLSFLSKLMQHHPIPVIVISSLSQQGSQIALEALELGALHVFAKPGIAHSVGELGERLRHAIRECTQNPWRFQARSPAPGIVKRAASLARTTNKIVAIGASTGGTTALEKLLVAFPQNAPGTVIVQHMPEGFTKAFAERLNGLCAVTVREAVDGDPILSGHVLIAPGNKHMAVQRSGGQYHVVIKDGPLIGHHRPAVEVLFRSVASQVGANAIGIMLTGMGSDGAHGLRAMRDAGARTIAQDEASSVVFGMPRAAIEAGGAELIKPLTEITDTMLALVSELNATTK